jgi:hypothetical protein
MKFFFTIHLLMSDLNMVLSVFSLLLNVSYIVFYMQVRTFITYFVKIFHFYFRYPKAAHMMHPF